MLEQPEYAWTGTDEDLARLVARHPWVTMVSATSHGLVVSHLPVIPDPLATRARSSSDTCPSPTPGSTSSARSTRCSWSRGHTAT